MNNMKRYFNIVIGGLIVILAMTSLTACSDDEWGNDNSEYENVFIVAFADWGPKSNNDKSYNVSQGSHVEIPVQLWCEGTRSFDAEAFVYVDTKLSPGTDYQIVDANGNVLQQNPNGGYTLLYDLKTPDATNNHRQQSIYVQALNGAKGDLTLMTFDPKDVDADGKLKISNGGTKPTDPDYYVPNNKTSQYEVRCITVNYKVKVTIQ